MKIQNSSEEENLNVSISSKFRKTSALRIIPTRIPQSINVVRKHVALKAKSVITKTTSKVQFSKPLGVKGGQEMKSVSMINPGKLSNIITSVRIKTIPSAKAALITSKIQISILGNLSVLAITQEIPYAVKLFLSKTKFIGQSMFNVTSRIPLKLSNLTMFRTGSQKMPQIGSPLMANNTPFTNFPTKPIAKIPVSDLGNPMKQITNIRNDTVLAFEEFSSLPMWMTMPLIFGSSFAIGAIVTLLTGK